MSKNLHDEIREIMRLAGCGDVNNDYLSEDVVRGIRRLINEKIQKLEKDDSEGKVVFYSCTSPGYTAYHDGFMCGAHWFAEELKK
jgi:hypothetical protein